MFVPRVSCGRCQRTDAVLPAFVVLRRLDVAESVGAAVGEVAGGLSGVRPAAARLDVPYATARDWVRRFAARSARLAVAFAALAAELGGEVVVAAGAAGALAAIVAAFGAASGLAGWAALGCWRFASAVSGGSLIGTNTDPLYLIVGRRRFMPPVP